MNETGNIIAIDKLEADKEKALAAFKHFMELSQICFNDHSKNEPERYAKRNAQEIEQDTRDILNEVKPGTAFANSKIELKSGHFFPDIIAGKHYGIEVKTTKENKWTSLGNSIFEGVSSSDITNIYMMFGNLGSTPPEFRFRPYQDCLTNIAVTHSPRYIIDMDIADNEEKNIFQQMNTSYHDYRGLSDLEKVALMRAHYLKRSKDHNFEMPWWMGDIESGGKLSFFSEAQESEKKEMIARALILFPSLYHNRSDRNKYKPFALWLCTRYGRLLYNVRDEFSASGMVTSINGEPLKRPYPQIAKTVLDYRPIIKKLLDNPDVELVIDIREMWDFNYDKDDLYSSWIEMVSSEFKNNRDTSFIKIKEHLENEDEAR